MTRRPITSGLFTTDMPVTLIGGRHSETGAYTFPCPTDPAYEAVPLVREGRLWSYTVQRFRPKSPPYAGPEAFEPYAVGYIMLPGQLIIESRLVNVAFDQLVRDLPMRVTTVAIGTDADGAIVETYAFEPVEQ